MCIMFLNGQITYHSIFETLSHEINSMGHDQYFLKEEENYKSARKERGGGQSGPGRF